MRDTYRMQLVCDGRPTRRHPVGDGQVSFDLGPSQIAVTVPRADGSWSGWVEPLADAIAVGHAAVAPHAAATGSSAPCRITRLLQQKMASTRLVAVCGSVPALRSRRV